MSAIKDGRIPIELDKERYMLFSLNVIDEIQDKYGDISTLPEKLSGVDGFKNLKWLLTLLLNEGRQSEAEVELTEKEVGRMIHMGNFSVVKDAIFRAFSSGNGTASNDTAAEFEPREKNEAGEAIAGKG